MPTAVVRVLLVVPVVLTPFHRANPAGKVPVTWLSSLSDLPPYPDMSMTASPGRTYGTACSCREYRSP